MIRGGTPLYGEVPITGFKNAALPILFATILTKDCSVIENLPRIRDVSHTLQILSAMGAKVTFCDPHTVMVDTSALRPESAPPSLAAAFRASSYLLGAELGRFGRSRVALPGGCRIGARPLDLHILALTALGADVTVAEGGLRAQAERLNGAEIVFPTPSVGATVNAILASVLADGVTRIRGAAREPHIVDLATYLNKAGADISRAGESEITVRGVPRLHGTRHRLMPDMIEAGTFLTFLGAAGGELTLRGADPAVLSSLILPLREAGLTVACEGSDIHAVQRGRPHPIRVTAAPYPAFPTDMHPQLAALLLLADGESVIGDTVFPDRFAYTEELCKMGGDLTVEGGEVRIRPARLRGATVRARDLRAGAALAVAGLAAEGVTEIRDAAFLERGYEDLPQKMRAIGAKVKEM